MYAVPASCGETPTWSMRPSGGSPLMCGRTFVQCAPPSRVTWTFPSSVPIQITFESLGASVMLRIVLYVSAPLMSYSLGPPLVRCLLLSLFERSGLITVQCAPPSVDLKSTLAPRYTVLACVAETAMGDVQLKRYFSSAGLFSSTPGRYGRMNFAT